MMPEWAHYLIRGIAMCALMCFSAVILSRAGRSPYWAAAAIVPVPYLLPVLVWVFAFCRWPKR